MQRVGVLERGLIIRIRKDGRILRAVDRRDALVRFGVLDVLDTVAAQHDRPIRLGVGLVLVQDLLIDPHCLVIIAVPAKMIRSAVQVGPLFIVQPRQRLLRPAGVTHTNRRTLFKLDRSTAHFAFEDCHARFPPQLRPDLTDDCDYNNSNNCRNDDRNRTRG